MSAPATRHVPNLRRYTGQANEREELLSLARSITTNEVTWFGEVIAINFAMVVGIYYFLNRAKIALKLFAFAVYLVGMLLCLGEMLIESNLKSVVLRSLGNIPHRSQVVQAYLDINASWLGNLTVRLFNGAFWLLALGVLYLLFFWKEKSARQTYPLPR